MNINKRGIVACLSSLLILALASVGATSFAQAQEKTIKDKLIGHWQLVSITINDTAPYGPNPKGSMFLDAAGYYSIIVLSGGDARNISYFGTYTANDADSSMTMHVEAGSRATADGRNQKRLVTFSGDELIQENSVAGGRRGSIKLTWKRSK